MSKTIDEKVVSMQFDNAQFEKNVSTSMSTLDKLKKSLNLEGASKGLENVNAVANRCDLSGLSNGVETVKAKFSALQVMAVTALGNITNSAVNAGKRMVAAITIEPIKAGFQEYETQMNSVQTILANTQKEGTNVKTVNKALDELNTYADKTIYNFTEMTRNIGTFTAAGVKLDTSVSSIKGIANLAAVSGSTSQQASTAMYQLSQAIASGTVKLMDWNSVINAGMGGQVFQDALIRTAEHLNTGAKAAIKAKGSFRESLQTGWLTTEVLTQTLDQFSTAADTQKEYEAAVKKFVDQGYTQEEAKQMADMAKTAGDAATKVKTFTQLIDTLKEALGSGWTTTWRLIVGDFEEARELWTSVSDTLSDMINKSSEARNKVVEGWAEGGGRTMAIEALKNAFEGLMNIIRPIKEAFRSVFPPATSEQLIKITERIRDLTEKFKDLTEKNAPKLKSTFKGLFSIFKIGVTVIKSVISGVAKLIGKFTGFSGGILGITGSIGEFISKIGTSITSANLFGKVIDKIVEFIGKGIDKIREFKDSLKEKIHMPGFDDVLKVFKKIGEVLGKVGKKVAEIASKIGKALASAFKSGDLNSLVGLVNGGIMTSILLSLKKFVKGFKEVKETTKDKGGIKDSIVEVLDGVKGSLEEWQKSIKAGTILKIAVAIGILALALAKISNIPTEKLGQSLGAISVLFVELMGSIAAFDKINGDYKGAFKAIGIMIGISASLLILASSLKKLSSLSWEELGKGLTGVLGLMVIIVGALAALSKVASSSNKIFSITKKGIFSKKTKANFISMGLSMIAIAAAMKIFASAAKDFASFSWEELGKAGSAIAGILLMVSGFSKLTEKSNYLIKTALGLVVVGAAMKVFASACKDFAQMDWEGLGKAGAAIGGILIAVAGFSKSSGTSKNLISMGVALISIAAAMKIFASSVKDFAGFSWEELDKAGSAVGGLLLALSLALNAMKDTLPGSAALLVAVGALLLLVPVMKALGSLSWESIIKGLVSVAGMLLIFGIAAYALEPVAGVLLTIAGSLSLFGVACLAVGVGILALSAGLAALAGLTTAAAASIVAAIGVIVIGLLKLIPAIVNVLTDAIVAVCNVIIQSAPAIGQAIKALVLSLIDVLVVCVPAIADVALKLLVGVLQALITYTPQLVNLLVEFVVGLLNALTTNLPQLVECIVNFIVALLDAVSANIAPLIEAGVRLFVAIFQGIADALGPIIESVVAPLLEILTNLFVGLANIIAPYIPDICDAFVQITQAITQGIQAIAPYIPIISATIIMIVQAITSAITKIVQAIVAIVQQIAPIIDSITNLISQLGDSITQILIGISIVIQTVGNVIAQAFQGIADVITACGDAIRNSLDGIAGVFDSAFGGIADVINSVGDTIQKFLDGIAGIIDSVGEAALNAGEGFKRLADGVKTITELNLADMAVSMGSVATNIGKITSHSEELAQSGEGMKQIADGVKLSSDAFARMVTSITLVTTTLSSVGTIAASSMSLLTSSVSNSVSCLALLSTSAASASASVAVSISSMESTCAAFSTALDGAAKTASGYYASFYDAGSYVAQGFADGIKDNRYKAEEQARIMAQNAATAAKKALDINSPSKVFRAIAYSIPEGFAQGIDRRSWMAEDSATAMAEATVNNTKSILSRIVDVIDSDIDAQPTIRPVVDLSDVTDSANSINGMFSMSPSVGVISNIRAIKSMMNENQNRSRNNDIVSALDKLSQKLGNTSGDTYTFGNITYDDGSNVSDAVKSLVRAVRVERRT